MEGMLQLVQRYQGLGPLGMGCNQVLSKLWGWLEKVGQERGPLTG